MQASTRPLPIVKQINQVSSTLTQFPSRRTLYAVLAYTQPEALIL